MLNARDVDSIRFDYSTRTDGNPVYLGKAPEGTATSDAAWLVQKFTYDERGRPVRLQVREGISWDQRSVGW